MVAYDLDAGADTYPSILVTCSSHPGENTLRGWRVAVKVFDTEDAALVSLRNQTGWLYLAERIGK